MADSAGMTLMDLISSDPTPTAPPPPSSSSSASPAAMPPLSSGTVKHATTDQKSKRGTLSQIQSNTISAAKAALNPVRSNILPQKHKQKKKKFWVVSEGLCLTFVQPVSYAQLARSIYELATTSDQLNLVAGEEVEIEYEVDGWFYPVSYAQLARSIYELATTSDQLNLVAGEEVEIEYEVDGWFYVKNKRPGRDGKLAGLVPVLYAC